MTKWELLVIVSVAQVPVMLVLVAIFMLLREIRKFIGTRQDQLVTSERRDATNIATKAEKAAQSVREYDGSHTDAQRQETTLP